MPASSRRKPFAASARRARSSGVYVVNRSSYSCRPTEVAKFGSSFNRNSHSRSNKPWSWAVSAEESVARAGEAKRTVDEKSARAKAFIREIPFVNEAVDGWLRRVPRAHPAVRIHNQVVVFATIGVGILTASRTGEKAQRPLPSGGAAELRPLLLDDLDVVDPRLDEARCRGVG